MPTLSEHAEHSPSSLKYKEICPGWVSQQEDERFQDFADEGTLMHAAAESGDLSKLNIDQRHFVQNVLDYVERVSGTATKVLKEQRLYASDPLLREKAHGTPDRLAFMDENYVHLIDYKFGRRPVDHAAINIQGFAYAIAVFDTYPEIQFVHVHFLAPRLADGFTNHVFERALDYTRLMVRVKRAVERAVQFGTVEQEYVPDMDACLYCGRRFKCGKLTANLRDVYLNTGDPIDKVELSTHMMSLGQEDEDDLSYIFKLAKVVKAWAESYEQYALVRHLNDGLNIDGYELRFRKGRSSIVDTPKAVSMLNEQEEIPVATILKACEINPKKLEALVVGDEQDEDKIAEMRKKLFTALAKADLIKTTDETQYLYKLNKTKKYASEI